MDEITVEYLKEYKEPDYDVPMPPAGKAWRSNKSGAVYLTGIKLGKLFFLNGKKLKEPIVETVDDFELINIDTENE